MDNNQRTVFDIIALRKSVRTFKDQPVEQEKITRILEAARLAPSSSNRQEWRFVVLNDRKLIRKVAKSACPQPFIQTAPVLIVACAKTDLHVMNCGQLSYPIDVAIALDHIALSAVELGLGACWIGMFDADRVKAALGIPRDIPAVSLMALGYPAEGGSEEKIRLPLSEIVRYNKW